MGEFRFVHTNYHGDRLVINEDPVDEGLIAQILEDQGGRTIDALMLLDDATVRELRNRLDTYLGDHR